MNNNSILETFRMIADEFKEISDEVVIKWIELTRPFVSSLRFLRLRPQALVYLTAHRLKLNQLTADESEGGAQEVSSISDDGATINYAVNKINMDLSDAALRKTEYGLMFLVMRQPILKV